MTRCARSIPGAAAAGGVAALAPELTGPDAAAFKAQNQVLAAGKRLSDQEKFKREQHPFDSYPRLNELAARNEYPKPPDNFRWRFFGLFYVAPNQNSYMCRLRIPNGILKAAQFAGVADLAARHGGGYAHVTTRANLQVREIEAHNAVAVIEAAVSRRPIPMIRGDDVSGGTCRPFRTMPAAAASTTVEAITTTQKVSWANTLATSSGLKELNRVPPSSHLTASPSPRARAIDSALCGPIAASGCFQIGADPGCNVGSAHHGCRARAHGEILTVERICAVSRAMTRRYSGAPPSELHTSAGTSTVLLRGKHPAAVANVTSGETSINTSSRSR